MKTIGAFAAKTHFSQLLADVEQGEAVIITKHNKAIAKIVPYTATRAAQTVPDIAEMMRDLRQKITLGKDLSLKQLRDMGRRT